MFHLSNFIYLSVFKTAILIDYCSILSDHILCFEWNITTAYGFKGCKDETKPLVITEENKTDILNFFNAYRGQVAKGQQRSFNSLNQNMKMPMAANMIKLEWDPLLADAASRIALTCSVLRIEPEQMKIGKYATSEIYTHHKFSSLNETMMKFIAGEGKRFNTSHILRYRKSEKYDLFTVATKASSRFVGCARMSPAYAYSNSHKYDYSQVCIFSPSEHPGWNVLYKVGPPCSGCLKSYTCSIESSSLCTGNSEGITKYTDKEEGENEIGFVNEYLITASRNIIELHSDKSKGTNADQPKTISGTSQKTPSLEDRNILTEVNGKNRQSLKDGNESPRLNSLNYDTIEQREHQEGNQNDQANLSKGNIRFGYPYGALNENGKLSVSARNFGEFDEEVMLDTLTGSQQTLTNGNTVDVLSYSAEEITEVNKSESSSGVTTDNIPVTNGFLIAKVQDKDKLADKLNETPSVIDDYEVEEDDPYTLKDGEDAEYAFLYENARPPPPFWKDILLKDYNQLSEYSPRRNSNLRVDKRIALQDDTTARKTSEVRRTGPKSIREFNDIHDKGVSSTDNLQFLLLLSSMVFIRIYDLSTIAAFSRNIVIKS